MFDDQILFMSLKRKWFYQILSGVKRIEYREIKPYWTARIVGKEYSHIKFTNGYGSNSPSLLIEYLGYSIQSFRGEDHYALKLGDIIQVKNVDGYPHRVVINGRYA